SSRFFAVRDGRPRAAVCVWAQARRLVSVPAPEQTPVHGLTREGSDGSARTGRSTCAEAGVACRGAGSGPGVRRMRQRRWCLFGAGFGRRGLRCAVPRAAGTAADAVRAVACRAERYEERTRDYHVSRSCQAKAEVTVPITPKPTRNCPDP